MNERSIVKRICGFVIVVINLQLACRSSKLSIEPILEDSGMIGAPGIVRINDSTRVHLRLPGDSETVEDIWWSVSGGRISGTGETATFFAPPDTGTSVLRVVIRKSNTTIRDSARIRIFKQIVILKADDFTVSGSSGISPNWRRFIQIVFRNDIKAGLGLIGNSLVGDNSEYQELIREMDRSERFEFWNHGYEHVIGAIDSEGNVYYEFKNTPLEYQAEHLIRTQNLAKDKLGLTLHTFGAPGNAIDNNTAVALSNAPEIKVWLFGMEIGGKLSLKRLGEIEFPTLFPVYSRFVQEYDSTTDCQVYQIHPNSWDEQRFDEFSKIIDFLISREVFFFKPYEYYLALKKGD